MADPAVIALASTALGGVLGVGGQFGAEHIKSRRDRAAGKDRAAAELRLSGRLVIEELSESATMIEHAVRSRRYWLGPRALPTATWGEHRAPLAQAIQENSDVWHEVTTAYRLINDLNWLVQQQPLVAPTTDARENGAWVRPEHETRERWRAIQRALAGLDAVTGAKTARAVTSEEVLWPHGDGDNFDEESAMLAEQYEREETERGWRR